tara:strand:+ start:60 stop:356 length:297 start_codon:yes stop_codon:yes gene_type:complete
MIATKVEIKKSTRSGKKMMAIFYDGDKKVKTIHFGADGYSDYTIHKDEARKQRYIDRHKSSEDWGNPMTAGTLALFILWNKPTISASIAAYKKKFGLK